jgi:hypothetical protein
LLPDLWEYPAAIALACTTRTGRRGGDAPATSWRNDLGSALLVAGWVVAASWLAHRIGTLPPPLVSLAVVGPAAVLAYRSVELRRRFFLGLLALLISGGAAREDGERKLVKRSFFGVLRVVDAQGERRLFHGTTIHGTQRLAERSGCVPRAYYATDGPLGSIFRAHRAAGRAGRTLGIGLGTGALVCHAAPGEPWRVIEINPDVITIASDPRWFTYLHNSPTRALELSTGDGRLQLERERDGSLSLLLVDAFNSDSVPVHLLTREALSLYLAKLADGGWLVMHLSNRVLDLARVVAAEATAQLLSGLLFSGLGSTSSSPAPWRSVSSCGALSSVSSCGASLSVAEGVACASSCLIASIVSCSSGSQGSYVVSSGPTRPRPLPASSGACSRSACSSQASNVAFISGETT